MKILELFAGTRSISKVFQSRGHEVFTVEWDKQHDNIDWYTDINNVTAEEILKRFGKPDVIWASPDCTTYSVAGIGYHRNKIKGETPLEPKTDKAKFADKTNQHVLQLIKELNPTFYFIENPRGGLRKMSWMQDLPRYTVTYCQYGFEYMKPTDIWTNHPSPEFKPPCKNGSPCHVPAPRGSVSGLQGVKGKVDRSIIPQELCEHIVDICERYIQKYDIIDIQDESDVRPSNSYDDIVEFLDNLWVDEGISHYGRSLDELFENLKGCDFYAESSKGDEA